METQRKYGEAVRAAEAVCPVTGLLVTSHRSLVTRFPALATVFLIGTPKRLEIGVSRTKQTPEVRSNRYKIRGVFKRDLAQREVQKTMPG